MPRASPLPPEERRAAILAATGPLLEQHGRNVSTRQIAEAAEVAEGTIFRVFPSKEALVDACVADAFDVSVTCAEITRIDPDGDLEHRLVQAVELLQNRLRRVFALFHALALNRDSRPDQERHAKHLHDNELLNSAIVALIGPDAASLRMDASDAANLLRTLTFSASHPFLSDRRHSEPEQIVDIALHGILSPHHDGSLCSPDPKEARAC